MEEKIAEVKYINQVVNDKLLLATIARLKNVSEYYKQIEKLREQRKQIMQMKQDKIMKIIKAKNEITDGVEDIKREDLFILKQESKDAPMVELKLTRSKIKDISNFSRSINYLRTPMARTLVYGLQWNASILHQNSESRVEKPEVIHPIGVIVVRPQDKIVLH